MSFANPMLLAGLAAIAVPILLHLMIREERSGETFPSLMFIQRVSFERRRRRTLRDRALLALRCLALALLVLAFAGPQLSQERTVMATAEWSRDSLLLLDHSASMSTPERWRQALETVAQQVDQLPAGERLAILTFDDNARLIAPLSPDSDLLKAQLNGLAAGSKGTGLGAALDLANRLLRESPAAEKSMLLVSDLQASALQGVDRLVLDRHVSLEVLEIDTPVNRNAAIIAVSLQQQEGGRHVLEIGLRNSGVEPLLDTEITVEIDDRVVERRRIDLLPDAEQTLRVPVVLAPDRQISGLVLLGDDQILADNWHHLVLMPDTPLDLALLLDDGQSAEEEVTLFIEQAARLASNPSIVTRQVSPETANGSVLAGADIAIIDASSAVRQPLQDALRDFVDTGGGLLLTMEDTADAIEGKPASRRSNDSQLLRGIGGLRRFPGKGTGIRMLPVGADPLLDRIVGGELAAALAGTRVFMARDVDIENMFPPGRILARLSDGEPWLIEQRLGRGRLLVMTTGLSNRWSNLVLERGFLPLLHATLRHLGSRPANALSFTLGEVVDLERQLAGLPGAADWRGYLAAGGSLIVEPPGSAEQRLPPGEHLYQPDSPGLYQVHRADGRPPRLLFAVNPAPTESLLEGAGEGALRERITWRNAPQQRAIAGAKGEDQKTGLPPGWYLLGLAVILFWLEALLANRLSRDRARATETGVTPV